MGELRFVAEYMVEELWRVLMIVKNPTFERSTSVVRDRDLASPAVRVIQRVHVSKGGCLGLERSDFAARFGIRRQ